MYTGAVYEMTENTNIKQRKDGRGTWHRFRTYVPVAICLVLGVFLLALSGTESCRISSEDTAALAKEQNTYEASLEERIEALCSSVEGVGVCRVMITFESGERTVYDGSKVSAVCPAQVQGVTVVCDGGNDPVVCRRLSDMLSALFGIGTHRVVILPLKK